MVNPYAFKTFMHGFAPRLSLHHTNHGSSYCDSEVCRTMLLPSLPLPPYDLNLSLLLYLLWLKCHGATVLHCLCVFGDSRIHLSMS